MTWDRVSSTHLDSVRGASSRSTRAAHATLSAPGESRVQDTSVKSALMYTMYVKTIGGKLSGTVLLLNTNNAMLAKALCHACVGLCVTYSPHATNPVDI
jgi:lysozyme family protein